MTLPVSGSITLAQIRTELGGGTSNIDMGAELPRLLAQKPTGSISMSNFYDKSCLSYTVVGEFVLQSTALTTAYVKQPTGIASNYDAGSISPNGQYREYRIHAVGTGNDSGRFYFVLPSDPTVGGELPRSVFYAVNIGGFTFFSADAELGGSAGGMSSFSWLTSFRMTPSQNYTFRVFY